MITNSDIRGLREWNAVHGDRAPQLFRPAMVLNGLSTLRTGGVFGSPVQEPLTIPTLNFESDDDEADEDDDEENEDDDAEDEPASKPKGKKRKPKNNVGYYGVEPPYVMPVLDFSDRKPKGNRRTVGGGESPYVPPTINWQTGEIEFS